VKRSSTHAAQATSATASAPPSSRPRRSLSDVSLGPLPVGFGSGSGLSAFASSFSSADRMFPTSGLEGRLLKLGRMQKNKLQPRFFVLLGSRLLSFLQSGDADSARGSIDLRRCVLAFEPDALALYSASPSLLSGAARVTFRDSLSERAAAWSARCDGM
jgi:hypothetical protein